MLDQFSSQESRSANNHSVCLPWDRQKQSLFSQGLIWWTALLTPVLLYVLSLSLLSFFFPPSSCPTPPCRTVHPFSRIDPQSECLFFASVAVLNCGWTNLTWKEIFVNLRNTCIQYKVAFRWWSISYSVVQSSYVFSEDMRCEILCMSMLCLIEEEIDIKLSLISLSSCRSSLI